MIHSLMHVEFRIENEIQKTTECLSRERLPIFHIINNHNQRIRHGFDLLINDATSIVEYLRTGG